MWYVGSEEEEQMANMLARVALRKYKVENTDEETIADEDWAVISAEAKYVSLVIWSVVAFFFWSELIFTF